MNRFSMLINGQLVEGKQHFNVLNPATEQVLAVCPAASKEQVDQAVKAAKQAFQTWRHTSLDTRHTLLRQIIAVIDKNQEALAVLLSQEQGKTLVNARVEINTGKIRLESLITLQLPNTVLQDDAKAQVIVEHRPIGVVAAITPWNYPFVLGLAKIATALVTGNTVVLKPSPYTPLSSLRLGELLHDIVPVGAVNIIAGLDEVGVELTHHPLVDKYTFTGSVPTGRAIAKIAAEGLKSATLELGGNDPAIVLPDVDINKVAEKLFWGAFTNSGQICIAIKRLYVHESIRKPLIAKLAEIAQSVKLGEGLDPESQMGPLNNEKQLEIVSELVNDAKKQGATVVTGGERLKRPGYFFPPTIVTDIKEGVRLVDEEQFGPVLPVISFTDVNEVIERANRTSLGLGASVWSGDWQKAAGIARQLESGVAWVNRVFETHPHAPFGGVKNSGIGREGGVWGLAGLTELQTVSIAKG